METDLAERIKILVVEDEYVTGCEIQGRLIDLGYDVPVVIDTGKEAIAQAADIHPRVVIMDITLKGEMTGIEAAEQIRKQFGIPVIFLTAHSDDATIDKAVPTEPFGYLIKPLDERSLQTAIRIALYKHSMDAALKTSENKYRAIAELADESIFIINPDLTLAYLNTYSGKVFECNPEKSIGKPIHSLFDASLSGSLIELADTVFSSGISVRETLVGTRNNTPIWLDTTIVPALSEGGEVTQIIVLSRDISEMVLLEREVDKKGIKQIEDNMLRFQILNDQIRNPLSIILSIASLDGTEESRIIVEQVKKIDNLVKQLDDGWIQSETVRKFLLKHYGHGKELD